MSPCKNPIPNSDKLCGMEIKWPEPYAPGNKPLNPDGSLHWGSCKANPNAPNIIPPTGEQRIPVTIKKVEPEPKVFPIVPPAEKDIEFQTADVTLEYDRNFRTVQFTVSKAKKFGQVTIPNLPDYESRDFFISETVAVDNPSVDIKDKVRQVFAEIDARIYEQLRKVVEEIEL